MRILGFAPLNDHFSSVFPKKLFNYSFCEKFQPSNFEIEMTFEIRKIQRLKNNRLILDLKPFRS